MWRVAQSAYAAHAQTGRLLAGGELRVLRWLKMLRFKDAEGLGAFNCEDFVDLAGKLFPATKSEALAMAHAAAAGSAPMASLESLAATLAYMEAATIGTPHAS